MKNPIDELKLQRLIDGESSVDEARSIRAAAKQHPDHWQLIAGALLEDRIWQRQFLENPVIGSVANLVQPLDSKIDVAALADDSGSSQPALAQPVSTQVNKESHRPRGLRSPLNGLAIAASTLLAAMLGYSVGQNSPGMNFPGAGGPDRVASSAAYQADDSARAMPTAIPKITPASLKADYHLELPADKESNLTGKVPLYAVESPAQWAELNQPSRDQFQLSPEILEQLRVGGFTVRKNINFVSGRLGDGRTFVVPIRSINFSPEQ